MQNNSVIRFIGFIKTVGTFFCLSIPFLLWYVYSLQLYAYEYIFSIDYSFFLDNSIEMKVWDTVLLSLFLATHSTHAVLLLMIFIVFYSALPLYITMIYLNDKKEKTINIGIRILMLIACIISYFVFIPVIMQVLQISEFFINEIKIKYITEHTEYCKIINGNNKLQLIVSENPAVPYKLFFAESTIKYFKPNEPIANWQKLPLNTIVNMQELCAKNVKY